MKICKDTKELYSKLMEYVNDVLDKEVSDTVKDIMIDHIVTDVYNSYTPSMHTRRYSQSGNDNVNNSFDDSDNTGLLDPNNIISTTDGVGGLEVKNTTLGSKYYYKNYERYISKNAGKPIVGVIETGRGYDVRSPGKRPFIKNTYEELENTGFHIKAMKQGLIKRGLGVKK